MLVEVLRPQLVVGLVASEHVIDRDEDRVADGDDCPPFAPARRAAAELGRQIRALHPAHHISDLGQGTAQPGVAVTGVAAEVSAAARGVARAHARPGGQMLGAGEAAHVRANLGDEHLRSAPGDTGDRREQRDRLPLSGQARFQLSVDARDGRIQLVEVGELLARAENT
jgi:hypothetical protein